MNIYVASIWRNAHQPAVVAALREAGHVVYDFRHPAPDNDGFHWSEIDPAWKQWSPEQFRDALRTSDIAGDGFCRDMDALMDADAVVLLLPCGRSAHLEAGFAAGAGKLLIVQLSCAEPELMYLMADHITTSTDETLRHLAIPEPAMFA